MALAGGSCREGLCPGLAPRRSLVHPELQTMWILRADVHKKTYFETYRFSEDLDFTLVPEAPIPRQRFSNSYRLWLDRRQMSGLELPNELSVFCQGI